MTHLHYRRLSPRQEAAIRAAYSLGRTARELAGEYDVSLPTIYRTLRREHRRTRLLEVDGWVTTVEMTDLGPVFIEPWRAA